MKGVFVLAVLVIVSFIPVCTGKNLNKRQIVNEEDENEPWIWGPYNTNIPDRTATKKSADLKGALVDNYDPCAPYNPTVPDFAAPGRRISEIKCYEFIWQLKNRTEGMKRDKECFDKQGNFVKIKTKYLILGGRIAKSGEFPHMAAIGWKSVTGSWQFRCGGSLISSKFVLTAAHCARIARTDTTVADVIPKIARLGDKNIVELPLYSIGYEVPIDKNIIRIIVNPLYKAPMKYNDIALMELDSDVVFSKDVQPACLWTDPNKLTSQATVTGWGVTDTAAHKTSPDLKAALLDIVDSKTCDEFLKPSCNRHWCGLQDHQFCAGKKTGVDSCQGDSGGPLQVKIDLPTNTSQGAMHYIIGITSFGFRCGLENMPGVYVRVASFLDWIEQIVWS